MHSNETKDKFIELRAMGAPMQTITETLGISRSTAFLWQTELKGQIANLRLLKLEAARARVLGPFEQRLKAAYERVQRYERELDARKLKYLNLEELRTLITDARNDIERLSFTQCYFDESPQPAEIPVPSENQP